MTLFFARVAFAPFSAGKLPDQVDAVHAAIVLPVSISQLRACVTNVTISSGPVVSLPRRIEGVEFSRLAGECGEVKGIGLPLGHSNGEFRLLGFGLCESDQLVRRPP